MNPISSDLEKRIRLIEGVIRQAPRAVGSIAVAHFKNNFRQQGFDGRPWPKRKYKTKNPGRPILYKSGRLMRSIRVVSASTDDVVVGSDVPYAKIHNEGGVIRQAPRSEIFRRNRSKSGKFAKGRTAGRGHTYKGRTIHMPKRKFIGDSKKLDKKVDDWYLRKLTGGDYSIR